ncbi:MAG: lipopolysaccharide biosynthesis protein [Bacteroidota bacterium]
MIKRNLVANYIGQGWSAIMSIAFIPLYIRYLGIESYGLIGLFGMLLTWLGLLDLGMTPTLSREMARFTGGAHSADSIRTLLRTIEIISLSIALIICVGVGLLSNWMASNWLKADKINPDTVAEAFSIMGIVTALRFVENIYRSAILGLQKHVIYNFVNIIISTLRGLGAVGVLIWISNSIRFYFIWQGIISVLTLIAFALITYKYLPKADSKILFSLHSLRGVGKFAGGILGISLLSLMLTQIDKVLLSKLLSLSEYGYYTLAAVSAGSLFLIIGPISQSWSPKLTELYALNDKTKLIEKYHQGSQLVTVIMGSAALIFIFFGENILFIWTHDADLAKKSSVVFRLLSIGNFLNGQTTMPYLMQMSAGRTSLLTKINIFAVLFFAPSLIYITPKYGAIGAASIWVILNAGYILIGIHFMFQKLLRTEKWSWFINDLFIPIIAAGLVAFLFSLLMPIDTSFQFQIIYLSIAATFVFLTASISSLYMRNSFFFMVQYIQGGKWKKNN